ncbi:neuronal tyrosine-phosphorylated phosphoinositide-3-kinase adapter 1 [Pristis pectinata]|uniref:neuronal tyrosine-phosphorylated phosphoinositide-3-kinase adapter 1 n=1 Tax=Pristis pectinata TaxID=685728 RepID=UPI00223C9A49|nr:neuronal tyrosine-phosphorylated phosphoinositide-3-kinase adapter 1 [Pristis pectinata]XP_051900641.1 neuronal tyrosine-phosphorylated phosphoinositide-3-kinase adapter 1 [Pristis pectinata]
MSSGLQDAAISSFLQFIEEKGLKAYNSLTSLSCSSDRVSRSLRHEMNLLYRKTKVEWKHREEEPKKSICKDGGLARVRDLASFRKHFRMGFMTMPASQEHGPHPCASGMTTRSLSLHSVGSVDNSEHPCARKQPDKPRRHPSTKLSLCTEGRNSTGREGDGPNGEKASQRSGAKGGDGGQRVLPLKAKFCPSAQPSVSFDESCPGRGAAVPARGVAPRCGLEEEGEKGDEEEEEPVYIEMVGDVFKEQTAATVDEDSEHNEAIYEEMKYPLAEEGQRDAKWGRPSEPAPRLPGEPGQGMSRGHHQPSSRGPPYDIPPPFPNLLLHRPPLLAFPQGPGQKSYQEAPPLLTSHGDPPPPSPAAPRPQKEDRNPQGSLLPSGRARSHSTPLPPQSSGQHRPEKELPSSQTMVCTPSKALAQSPLPAPLALAPPKADREKLASLSIICSSVKVTAHPLLAHIPGEPRAGTDKELSGLQSVFHSVGKSSAVSRPLSGLYKVPVAHGLLEHGGLPVPGSMIWPYLPAACKRPPAYESLRPKGCLATHHSTVKTQGQERPAVCSTVCCSRSLVSSESRPASGAGSEASAGPGRVWQRKLSCSKKVKEAEGGPRSRGGAEESLAKEEKPSSIPAKSQGLEDSTVKAPSRSGVHQPCPLVCQWSADSALNHRLGRSASTSGVQHSLAQLQRQCSQSRDSPTQIFQQQPGLREKDGKLLEVIERKRCLCKEIKARRGPDRSLCKQDSMPILPSWKRGVDTRKTGTPPCQRQHTVLWDTAI